MTINRKPGNQPDADDMSSPFENDGHANNPATTPSDLGEEDEAAILGDFA